MEVFELFGTVNRMDIHATPSSGGAKALATVTILYADAKAAQDVVISYSGETLCGAQIEINLASDEANRRPSTDAYTRSDVRDATMASACIRSPSPDPIRKQKKRRVDATTSRSPRPQSMSSSSPSPSPAPAPSPSPSPSASASTSASASSSSSPSPSRSPAPSSSQTSRKKREKSEKNENELVAESNLTQQRHGVIGMDFIELAAKTPLQPVN